VPLNPLHWGAGPFLVFYAVAVLSAAALGWMLPTLRRPAGRPRVVTDMVELAMLMGGPTRVAEAGVAHRLSEGSLRLSNKRFHPPAGSYRGFRDPSGGGATWAEVRSDFAGAARAARRRLEADGLLMDADALARARLAAMAAPVIVLLLGTVRLMIGIARDRPVGLLLLLMLAMLVLAAILWTTLDRRTVAGRQACSEARKNADRLRRAPTRSETGVAVALFGTGVLAASHLSDFHQLRSSGGEGGDGGSGCGSDGGGCGGGCGGCGGD